MRRFDDECPNCTVSRLARAPPTELLYLIGAIDGHARMCEKQTQPVHLVDSGTDWPVGSLFQLDTAFLFENTYILALVQGCV